jgi:hypothetical protein
MRRPHVPLLEQHTPLSHYMTDLHQFKVSVNKRYYAEFKKMLDDRNLYATWAIEEFILRYVQGDKHAQKIVDNLVADKQQRHIDGYKLMDQKLSSDEIDTEMMYRLIEGDTNVDEGEDDE